MNWNFLIDLQEYLYEEYLTNKKKEIFEGKGKIGDIAELGLMCAEIGEVMEAIREKKDIDHLQIECSDVIIRMINFMSRKNLDLCIGIQKAHLKNVDRARKGLFKDVSFKGDKTQ